MEPQAPTLTCPRCPSATPLDFLGTKKFHEGTNWGALGELGELFTSRQAFDVYACPTCGRVELFLESVGRDLRPPR
jgi:hypothetical protein